MTTRTNVRWVGWVVAAIAVAVVVSACSGTTTGQGAAIGAIQGRRTPSDGCARCAAADHARSSDQGDCEAGGRELVKRLADGVDYTFWTFGGVGARQVHPGSRGRRVEFHLSNDPANKMPHNIDLHAVTGPGGGAPRRSRRPGTPRCSRSRR